MSRTSLYRPRRPRAVRHRTATDTRLLPSLFSSNILHLNPHYKRCPKALRLRLRSDLSPSRPLHGRSPDKSRLALSKGPCQVRAPLTRRKGIAASGDAPEHGVMSLPWATAPFPDSPGLALAGESEQSDERRLKTNAPFLDSTVVTTGELPTTNAGHGSPLPSLGMVEHFWWSRLPHGEISSRLLHILSEVRGCRRAVADVKRPQGRTPHIATGVADILRKRPGPSTTPTGEPVRQRRIIPSLHLSNELEAEALESLPQSGRGSGRIHPSRTTTYNPTPSPHPEEKRNSPKTIKNPA